MPFPRKAAGVLAALVAFVALGGARAADAVVPPVRHLPPRPPGWLPHYDLDMRMDLAHHLVEVRERVTWTNRHARPASELVFNAHSHYKVPDDEIGFMAKMLEILRVRPSEAIDDIGEACQVEHVNLVSPDGRTSPLPFDYRKDNATALAIPLPFPVGAGESVTVELAITMRLPHKYGRWGQWDGVTFLCQWLPVLAFHDDNGWQPTP